LRRQYGPVAPVEIAPGVRVWLVLGYREALEVLRRPEVFSRDTREWADWVSGRVPADSAVRPILGWRPSALYADGDRHRRLREPVTASLDRVEPTLLRSHVEKVADGLIDGFAGQGRADLVVQYAVRLPLLVVSRLLGCPDEVVGRRVVDGLIGAISAAPQRAQHASAELTACLGELVALKREHPGADVTSWLISYAGEELGDEELVHQLVMMAGAACAPATALIASTTLTMLTDDRFAGSLFGGSLTVQDALEEMLWRDPPMANYSPLVARVPQVVGGAEVAAGELLLVSYTAANNDPVAAGGARWGNRGHLGWGAGAHRCPVRQAGQLIVTTAVEGLLERLPDARLDVPPDRLGWQPGPFYRCLASLPVTFTPELSRGAS
jgi:cytochrome P450